MRGVYKITNKINNKVYIGESLDIRERWDVHIEDLNNNQHHSYKLQEDWNKYNESDFEFSIVSVLEDNIETYSGKCILIAFEHKYIHKYNSINEGYNNEDTLLRVLKGDKKIFHSTKDKNAIKSTLKEIKNNHISEFNGIIFLNSYSLDDVKKSVEINTNDTLKKLLYNNNLIIPKENNKTYILNEDIFNREDIICNDTYIKAKFNEKIYKKLVYEINKILSSENTENVEHVTKNKKINDDVEFSRDSETIRSFLNNYTLNIKYNEVFQFLRNKGILEYKYFNDKKVNLPSEFYKNCFTTEEKISPKDGQKYISLLLTYEGKKVIYNILSTNLIIN